MTRVVILGAGGDGSVLASAIDFVPDVQVVGFLDDGLSAGTIVDSRPVFGGLKAWKGLDRDFRFIAALHKVRKMVARVQLLEELRIPDERWVTVVDPSARVSRTAIIGRGSFIGPNVVIQPNASVGSHASVRAGASIGHDCVVGDFVYVGPNATLCGRVTIDRGAHVGPNSSVADGVTVESFSVVGIGSAVTKRVFSGHVVFGVPAKEIFAKQRP